MGGPKYHTVLERRLGQHRLVFVVDYSLGELFRGHDTDRVVVIGQIFEADSIVFVFNNDRFESHSSYSRTPNGNSLFDSASYTEEGIVSTYTIDNRNYDDVTLCDGTCP
jgi:hypothetical protein